MKKNIKKWFCVLLAVALLVPPLALCTGAIAPADGESVMPQAVADSPLKVEITANKDKYSLLNKIEFTATITNTGNTVVNNISAEANFNIIQNCIRGLKKNSQATATKASLAPGESFQMRFYAQLNPLSLKGIDTVLLPLVWITSVFRGGLLPQVPNNGFNDGREYTNAQKTVGLSGLFGTEYVASVIVGVWYEEGNNDGFVPSRDADSYVNDDNYYSASLEGHVVYHESGITFVDNELDIFVANGVSQKELESVLSKYNAIVVGRVVIGDTYGHYQVRFPKSYSLEELQQLIEKLAVNPKIKSVRLEETGGPADANIGTNDTLWKGSWTSAEFGDNWGVRTIRADKAWDYKSYMTHQVNIGVFDLSFQSDHVDLKFSEPPLQNVSDNDNHGTHVAGIIAATHNNEKGITGIAPLTESNSSFKLYGASARGLEENLAKEQAPVRTYKINEQALVYLIKDCNSKVVNISLGYNLLEFASQYNKNASDKLDSLANDISELLSSLLSQGYEFLICHSAGNQGDFANPEDKSYRYSEITLAEYNKMPDGWGYVGYKQDDKGTCFGVSGSTSIFARITNAEIRNRIITVGAIIYGYGYGDQIFNTYQIGNNVDIVAPGIEIQSTIRGNAYKKQSGTSMASPHVAGTAAMVFACNPNLTGKQVKEILLSTATGNYQGHRLVNAENAVFQAIFAETTGPLEGIVRDADTDEELLDANVLVTSADNSRVFTEKTRADGTFNLTLPEGNYRVEITLETYESYAVNVTISASATTFLPVLLQKQGGSGTTQGTITGKVLEQGTNTPLAGVLVEASKIGYTQVVATATTNASGQYSLTVDWDSIAYNLKFSKSGYVGQTRENVILGDSPMVLSDVAMVFDERPTGDDGITNWDFIIPVTHQKTVPTGYTGIYTAQDLDNVRNNLSGNYILMNNIDLSSWGNWEPFGTDNDSPFGGTFDGNGYVIKSMLVNIDEIYGESISAGLFSCLQEATIKNVGIVNSKVTVFGVGGVASAWAGGIAGSATSSTINNCYNAGIVESIYNKVTGGPIAGGIVGGAYSSSVKNCYNTGEISSNSTTGSTCAGGIVGYIGYSTVNNCYNAGIVSAMGNPTNSDSSSGDNCSGGIVGYVNESGGISNSYNTGKVNAISSSTKYRAFSYTGGIVGVVYSPPRPLPIIISSNYNIGIINATANNSADAYVGGIIGEIIGGNNSAISNCYYKNDIDKAVGNDYGTLTNVNALAGNQMKQQSSYAGFDFDTIWAIDPAINDGYPYLRGMQP